VLGKVEFHQNYSLRPFLGKLWSKTLVSLSETKLTSLADAVVREQWVVTYLTAAAQQESVTQVQTATAQFESQL